MPLKERSGKLLREFININYKVINSHEEYYREIYEVQKLFKDLSLIHI